MAEEEERKPLDIYEVLAVMLDQIASIAWQKLGLQPDPITSRIEPDLDQAKVAIDLAANLASGMDAKLDDADRTQVHGLVRDLRLNYVQKRKDAGNE